MMTVSMEAFKYITYFCILGCGWCAHCKRKCLFCVLQHSGSTVHCVAEGCEKVRWWLPITGANLWMFNCLSLYGAIEHCTQGGHKDSGDKEEVFLAVFGRSGRNAPIRSKRTKSVKLHQCILTFLCIFGSGFAKDQ